MDFSFNEDQQLIAESAQSFLAAASDSAAVRASMATESGFDASVWQQVSTELGWQLTHIPEQYDGLGLGYVELCILMEAMGQTLFCSPFFSTSVLATNALLVAGSEAQKSKHLKAFAEGSSSIAEGSARATFAYSGPARSWALDAVNPSYQQTENGIVLTGEAHYVIDGHTAETIVVAAKCIESGGLGLFIVPASSKGVTRQWTPSMDQTRKLALIRFDQVEIEEDQIMLNLGTAEKSFMQIFSLANIALAAEQMGVAERSLAMTVEYIKERKQFGRTVGSFQAMKHKAADMMAKAEASRSAVYYAACVADLFLADKDRDAELHEAASIAKAYACEAAFFNAGCAIQMHGGVGFTWEYDVHLYFKRAKAAQNLFADSAWHRENIAKILLGDAL